MTGTINQSFAEVYDIIMHLEKELYDKIPKNFIKIVESNMDKEYKVNIDYNKNINDQNLLQDTRAILSLVYRDYLCSPEEKKELIEKDKKELELEEERKREKYNPDNIFKNANTTKIEESEQKENTQIVEYKENIFKKFINKILKFLHKK